MKQNNCKCGGNCQCNTNLKSIIENRKNYSLEILDAWRTFCALYSKKDWLILHEEYLTRMENEY